MRRAVVRSFRQDLRESLGLKLEERRYVCGRQEIGKFVAAVGLLSSATPLLGQAAPNREAAVDVRKQFMTDLDTLQSKSLALAEAVPADKYAWRPAPGAQVSATPPASRKTVQIR